MAISGAAIVAGCALMVWCASAGHIHSPYLRATLAAMVVLLPIVGVETLDNVTNSIWFLFFAAFWILLWRPASSPAQGRSCYFLCGCCGSSQSVIVEIESLWRPMRLVSQYSSSCRGTFETNWGRISVRMAEPSKPHCTDLNGTGASCPRTSNASLAVRQPVSRSLPICGYIWALHLRSRSESL